MSEPSPTADELEFECPLCGGRFAIAAQWVGHEVECPHCQRAVQLAVEIEPAGDVQAPANPLAGIADRSPAPRVEAPPPEPPIEPRQPAPARLAPRTAAERAAIRRRVNLVLAITGAVVLVATFLVLSWLAQPK